MVRKTVGEQRIGTHLSSRGNAVWNSYCLLPDGMRVGYFKDSRSRVIEFCEIGEIDMRPHMISNAEIRMTNDEGSPNDEFRIRMSILDQLVVIRASSLVRHSAFTGMMGNGVIVTSCFSREENVAKAATAPLGRLVTHHRNKPE